jgi:glycoside hydrolase-like protein
MRRPIRIKLMIAALALGLPAATALAQTSRTSPSYLGFDRNDYPGDESLTILRKTFSFSGYWLNNPPGSVSNSWAGKRPKLQAAGFGFLVLFNGRSDAQIKKAGDAGKLGRSDAASAIAAARKDGFPAGTLIFLDQEEGGRLLPEQKEYLYAWVDAVNSGRFRAGVYCPGIAFQESGGIEVVTAQDIRQNAGDRKIAYWIANDSCPPSPGCGFSAKPPDPSRSGVDFADVWQFAQSPARKDVSQGCPKTYNADGNCYPPTATRIHVDLDTATSPDPSHARLQER